MKSGLQSSVFSLPSIVYGLKSKVCRRQAAAGFTLLELLVVIAMIGVLAGITIPTVMRVQDRGREVQCMSNLKQLHTAAMSFANGGRLPRAYSISIESSSEGQVGSQRAWVSSVRGAETNDAQGHAWWYEKNGNEGTLSIVSGTLYPYLEDTSVYACPTMAKIARRELAGDKRNVVRSYGMNARLTNAKYRNISGPSRKMLFADQGFMDIGQGRELLTGGDDGESDEGGEGEDLDEDVITYLRYNTRVDGAIDAGDSVDDTRYEWIGEYHGADAGVLNEGRANVVFVDGHVESVLYIHADDIADGDWEDGAPIE